MQLSLPNTPPKKKREKRKEFLTLEEVKQLAATPCQHDVLKRAALFSIVKITAFLFTCREDILK